jgi:hypothetical protein
VKSGRPEGAATAEGAAALAPALLGGDEELGAHHQDGDAVVEAQPEVLGARQHRVAVGQPPAEQIGDELGDGPLGGPGGGAHALDLGGDERRDEPQHHRRGRVSVTAAAHPQLPDRLVGDAQLDDIDAVRVGQQRALVGRRPRGHGEHRARSVDQREARIERTGRRTDDLR